MPTLYANKFRDLVRLIKFSRTARRFGYLQLPDLAHQITEKRLPQFIDFTEAARERLFVSGVFEALQLPVLLQVNLDWIIRATGEVKHRGFSSTHEFVDLFHAARFCNACAGADFGPEHAHQHIASTDELTVDRILRSDA